MPPELIDTHCHLDYEPLASEVEAVLARARAVGVRDCVSIGTTLETSRANVALAHRYPMVRAAVGIHPNESATVTDAALAQIEQLADDPRVVAIGEVGLDHYRDHASPDQQLAAFRGFLAIATRKRLPVLIHCRNAYEPLLDVLRHDGEGNVRGVIHCASGPPEFIKGALELGCLISFAGNVTFPNAHALRALVPLVPDERLLVETDAPFLAPQPVRGQPNEPAYVAHTAFCVASLRGTTVEVLGALTGGNARQLFGFAETHAGDG